jgi:arylsulfatase A
MAWFRIIYRGFLFFTVVAGIAPAVECPNIIVIYTDDQGWGDVSALNPAARFETPNLDRLAQEGIAFTRAHSPDSVCTPSRYGLLTGRYAWRTHLKRGVFGSERTGLIADGRMTLASMLRGQGYATAMVGKWHLGMEFPSTPGNRDWTQPVTDMPLDKGFDYFYGIPASLNFGILAWFEGRHAAVPPTLYTNKKPNNRYIDYRIIPPYDDDPETTLELWGRPGLEVAPDFVDNQCLTRFTDKAISWMGAHAVGAEFAKPFFLYLAYTSPHYPVCPLPEFQGQGHAGAYGEFMIETDHHVGRILAFLAETGLDDNTLIIFTSDNGPERSWQERLAHTAHDSRGGLREGKRSVYEGGHRVPFLVRWPAGIVNPGRRWDKVVGQVDLLATFAELTGSTLPADAGEDSQSFACILYNPDSDYQRLPLINHGNDGRYAVTEGDWKLILQTGSFAAELYDLSKDRGERHNLANKYPHIVENLTDRINRIIAHGRTSPGPIQPNDTEHWKDLAWLTRDEYQALINSPER